MVKLNSAIYSEKRHGEIKICHLQQKSPWKIPKVVQMASNKKNLSNCVQRDISFTHSWEAIVFLRNDEHFPKTQFTKE